jgi:hypothetical protein
MTHISQSHKALLDVLHESGYTDLALFSCFVNGDASVAICRVVEHADGWKKIIPLMVTVTYGMYITDHDDVPTQPDDDDEVEW